MDFHVNKGGVLRPGEFDRGAVVDGECRQCEGRPTEHTLPHHVQRQCEGSVDQRSTVKGTLTALNGWDHLLCVAQ